MGSSSSPTMPTTARNLFFKNGFVIFSYDANGSTEFLFEGGFVIVIVIDADGCIALLFACEFVSVHLRCRRSRGAFLQKWLGRLYLLFRQLHGVYLHKGFVVFIYDADGCTEFLPKVSSSSSSTMPTATIPLQNMLEGRRMHPCAPQPPLPFPCKSR